MLLYVSIPKVSLGSAQPLALQDEEKVQAGFTCLPLLHEKNYP